MQEITREQVELMRRACLLCDNSKLEVRTGCILLLNGEIVSEHWNLQKESAGHAEMEAIKLAHEKGVIINGLTVYVTRFPCIDCARVLIHHFVKDVFYMSDHFTSGNASRGILDTAGVTVTQIPESLVWEKS